MTPLSSRQSLASRSPSSLPLTVVIVRLSNVVELLATIGPKAGLTAFTPLRRRIGTLYFGNVLATKNRVAVIACRRSPVQVQMALGGGYLFDPITFRLVSYLCTQRFTHILSMLFPAASRLLGMLYLGYPPGADRLSISLPPVSGVCKPRWSTTSIRRSRQFLGMARVRVPEVTKITFVIVVVTSAPPTFGILPATNYQRAR